MTASVSIKVGPIDRRCKYWAKVIPAGMELPTPAHVSESGAAAIATPFLKNGDEELLMGEFLIECEQVHHSKPRGYDYWVSWMHTDGRRVQIKNPGAEHKAVIKAAGMAPELLKGSGHLASCIRLAIAVRAGMYEPVEDDMA